MSRQYSGSLHNKLKSEISEIADALHIKDSDQLTKLDLILLSDRSLMPTKTSTRLIRSSKDSSSLAAADLGERHDTKPGILRLATDRRSLPTESEESVLPSIDVVVSEVSAAIKKPRKSLKKAVEAAQGTIESAVALQEPIAETVEAADQAVRHALVPVQNALQVVVHAVEPQTDAVSRFIRTQVERYRRAAHVARDHLAAPENLVGAALSVELIALFVRISQWYDHAVFFPPAALQRGLPGRLFGLAFWWAPDISYSFRLPEIGRMSGWEALWSASGWWFCATILPALAASSVINYLPHQGVHHRYNTRYAESHKDKIFDPLTFAIFRLAILILPLTSAAPYDLTDALALSANAQLRALGAALLAVLLLVDRLHA